MNISKAARDLIIKFETGGKSYYEKVYKSSFVWPEGASGCTAGFGVDIGYYTKKEVQDIFGKYVTPQEMELILGGVGKKGAAAKDYCKKLKGIIITWDEASEIFDKYTLPKFIKLTVQTFPGADKLHENAFGALVSLVFNRGSDLRGERRKEMKAIRELVPGKNYKSIAAQIRSMKRLWKNNPNSTSDLTDRREAEAKLVESA